ncbi:MAG: T9SS type A sorting domain-containing protein [Bacteroidetes bacterium]|nr:T9SS type A sorting domain-containing protein [Bacteroidota bacterium]
MKQTFFFFAMLGLSYTSLQGQTTNPAPYCDGKYDDDIEDGAGLGVPHYISNLSFGTLVNNSGATQYPGGHYVYYNNLAAPNLMKGNTYTLSLTHDGSTSIHFVAVYIDFNGNHSFADAGERVMQFTINDPSSIPNPATVTLTIPSTATPGQTRMRAMVFEDDYYTFTNNNTNATPCTNFVDANGGTNLNWGETEDYNINIVATTGLNTLFSNQEISVFPNPSQNMVRVAAGQTETILKTELFDALGNALPTNPEISGQNIILDISLLEKGVYYLRITSKEGTYTKKLIKE